MREPCNGQEKVLLFLPYLTPTWNFSVGHFEYDYHFAFLVSMSNLSL